MNFPCHLFDLFQAKAGMLTQLLAACRQHAGDVSVQEAALSLSPMLQHIRLCTRS